jgi:hypothetical protein
MEKRDKKLLSIESNKKKRIKAWQKFSLDAHSLAYNGFSCSLGTRHNCTYEPGSFETEMGHLPRSQGGPRIWEGECLHLTSICAWWRDQASCAHCVIKELCPKSANKSLWDLSCHYTEPQVTAASVQNHLCWDGRVIFFFSTKTILPTTMSWTVELPPFLSPPDENGRRLVIV